MRNASGSSGRAAVVTERLRASVVSVMSPTARGTGYCALPNGLVVTSLDVVGFERHVGLVLDDGSTVPALVVRANVALDVALLMPLEPAPLVPLEPGPEPAPGDWAALLSRLAQDPVTVETSIAATHRVAEGFPHLWVDVPTEDWLLGAPLVGEDGRTFGVLTRPRRARSHGERTEFRWIGGLVLPNAAFEGGLMSADGPQDEVLTFVPEYGCQRCDTVFDAEMDRCMECGAVLPHRWSRDVATRRGPPPSKGLYAVKAALASVGVLGHRARVGPRTWRFSPAAEGDSDRTQVDLTTDERGDYLVLRAPVARLPAEGFEHLYRHLLAQNDGSSGAYRFSVFDDSVYVSLFQPTAAVHSGSFPTLVSEFTSFLESSRSALQGAFGLEPAFEHQGD
jgi:hypothetical protein